MNKRQTGSKNKRAIGAKMTTKKVLNPWGSIFPQKKAGKAKVRGSSTRKSRPAPELFKMYYPANQPSQWPVEIDTVGHTTPEAGHRSGYTQAVADRQNAQVNNAFKRGGYAG